MKVSLDFDSHIFLPNAEIGTINIEEMVLENYGQDYDELDVVDVDGVDEEILEDIEEDLLDDVDESEEEEEEEPLESTPEKSKAVEESAKGKSRVRDRSKRTRDDGDGSSGEEAWLKALESGKLEEVRLFINLFLLTLFYKIFLHYPPPG